MPDLLNGRFLDSIFILIFEHEFIGQGMDENRSMEDTLNKAWELLGLLPREELDRVNTKVLDQYYHPTTIDAVAKAKAEADAMNE